VKLPRKAFHEIFLSVPQRETPPTLASNRCRKIKVAITCAPNRETPRSWQSMDAE